MQVSVLALDLGPATEFTLEGGFLPAHAGGGSGVFPEIRVRGLTLQVLEFGGQAGEVKDAP